MKREILQLLEASPGVAMSVKEIGRRINREQYRSDPTVGFSPPSVGPQGDHVFQVPIRIEIRQGPASGPEIAAVALRSIEPYS